MSGPGDKSTTLMGTCGPGPRPRRFQPDHRNRHWNQRAAKRLAAPIPTRRARPAPSRCPGPLRSPSARSRGPGGWPCPAGPPLRSMLQRWRRPRAGGRPPARRPCPADRACQRGRRGRLPASSRHARGRRRRPCHPGLWQGLGATESAGDGSAAAGGHRTARPEGRGPEAAGPVPGPPWGRRRGRSSDSSADQALRPREWA